MAPDFETLLHYYGALAQQRQCYVAAAFPETTGGWDIDLRGGTIRWRMNGRQTPVQVIGTESQGTWIWGDVNRSFPPQLMSACAHARAAGRQYGCEEFEADCFDLPPWQRGETLSGMSCTVVAAGMCQVPGLFACHDRANDIRLWVVLADPQMHESIDDPFIAVVDRFPKFLMMASEHPHRGGITLVDWRLALAGYAQNHGISAGTDEEGAVVLQHDVRTAKFRINDGKLSVQLYGFGLDGSTPARGA